MKKQIFLFFLLTAFACSCGDDEGPSEQVDNFDRQAMLTNWADNIIVPAFSAFAEKTTALKDAGNTFATSPSNANYEDLVTKWETAYLGFQEVSMFEIGKAEELRMTNNLNIYPTNVAELTNNVMNGGVNLELPSQIDRQGFPALDYLLFGIADNQTAILEFYQNDGNANQFLDYLNILTDRIDNLAQAVLSDWENGYRDSFINNSGNSATASVDKLTNDFIFYYEKHLRAGKIGIPAGVFSGDALSDKVEGFYKKNLSKALFNRSLDAVENFFNGAFYNNTSTEGESFKEYLEYLKVTKNEVSLATVINDEFQTARTTAQELSDNFADQVEIDNVKMLATYDQLQINVVNIKVDMLQAFNINIDYIDADGD